MVNTIAQASQRGVGHAERLIAKLLDAMGIDPAQVTRIYSELEPCVAPGGFRMDFLRRVFPQADITYSFEYGLSPESRKAGVEALKIVIKKIFEILK